jgi:hypothetical protein
MACHRCRGLLVKDQSIVEGFRDLSEVTGCNGPDDEMRQLLVSRRPRGSCPIASVRL